jgi:hypothetical protein
MKMMPPCGRRGEIEMDKVPLWVEREVQRAGKLATPASGPRALAARYDRKNHRVVVDLTNGCTFTFLPSMAQGLTDATTEQLAEVRVAGRGYGLHWPSLDADLSVPGLLAGLFGSSAWMKEMGRLGGSSTSEIKRAAARANGRKGGRPKKAA